MGISAPHTKNNQTAEKSEATGGRTPFFSPDSGFFSRVGPVQPKLTVNAPDDKFEKEADAMADQVMRMPDSPIRRRQEEEEKIFPMKELGTALQRKCEACKNEEVQMKPQQQRHTLQRKCTECEEEEQQNLQRKPLAGSITPFFQRKARGTGGGEVNGKMAQLTGGSGRPLPDQTRGWMERRFGADFSKVRVHTGPGAIQLSRDLHAQAFTHGRDIYFNRGRFSPGTGEGKRLLAHELTHVIQQGGQARGIQMQRRVQDSNVYETEHEGVHYRVRRIRVPKSSSSSSPEPPQVRVDVDSENVTLRISWCQGTRGEVRIGGNLTGQALSLAQEIAGIITSGGSGDEVLEALRGTDVTPFVETVVARSGEWRIFVRGDVTVGADGVTAGSGSIGVRRGPVDVEVAGEGDESGGNVSVRVRVTPGRSDETFDCPREVTVRQTYINRYICERHVPAHEETRTRTEEREDRQTQYIYFNYAEDVIDETRSRENLARIQELLMSGYQISLVEGYTSPEGPEAPGRRFMGNRELAEKRADAALIRLQTICENAASSLLTMRACADNALTDVSPLGQSELYGSTTDEDGTTRELRGGELEGHTIEQFRENEQESPHRSEEFLESLEGLTPAQQADRIYPLLRRAVIVLRKHITEEVDYLVEVPAGYLETACPEEVLSAARLNFNIRDAVRSE